MNEFIDILTDRFGIDSPILTEDILATFSNKSRQTIYRWIATAVENGTLSKYDRGVYYIPRQTRFGQSLLFPDQVIRRKWLEKNGDIVGYISGPTLANSIGITEQVPATLEITTNRETTRLRQIRAFGGWKNITLRRPRTTVTADNVQALRFLDIITNESPNNLNTYALDALTDLAAKADREQIFRCAAFYPAKTSKSLIECERKNVLA